MTTAHPPANAHHTSHRVGRWSLNTPLLATGIGLGVLGLLIGLFVTADGARRTGELRLDVWLSTHRDSLMRSVSKVIDVAFGTALAPVWVVVIAVAAWACRERFAALVIPLLALPGWFSSGAGKILVHRLRPPTATVHALVNEAGANSFPSGHVTFAAALVCAVAVAFRARPTVRNWVLAVGIPLVVLVAASRLVLGAHYLGDVIAAPLFAVGTILVLCAIAPTVPARLLALIERRRAVAQSRA